jgi:IgA Peptidase M64
LGCWADDTVISTTIRNTALGYIYGGSWAHCWLEDGANTSTKVKRGTLHLGSRLQPSRDHLEHHGVRRLRRRRFQIVTKGVGWDVLAHEFGHGTGGLADEYCTSRSYSGGEPGAKNVTVNTNRATLKSRHFVDPATPVPTATGSCAGYTAGAKPAGWSDNHDAGPFEGGGTNGTRMYRPVINCGMRGNSP